MKTEKIPEKKTDLQLADLSGEVKQVKQKCYKAKKREGEIVQGKIVNEYSFNKNSISTIYDKKGHKIAEQLYGTDGAYTHIFNHIGLTVNNIHYNTEGALYQTTTHSYKDDNGNSLEMICTNADGTVYHRTLATYTEQGNRWENFHWMGDKERLLIREEFLYNEKGLMASHIRYKEDKSIEYKSIHRYNEQGKEVEQINEWTDKAMAANNKRITFVYNDHGDAIETNFYKGNGTLDKTYNSFYEYDDAGKRIMPVHVPYQPPAKSPLHTEECENDAQGNWIKKTTFFNKNPMNIYYREIDYYGKNEKDTSVVSDLMQENIYNDFFKELMQKVQPIEENNNKTKQVNMNPETEEFSSEQTQWLVESTTADNFLANRYYALVHKEVPSLLVYTGPHIEAHALLNELKENMEAQMIHSYSTIWDSNYERLARYTLSFPDKAYLLHATQIQSCDADEFDVPESIMEIYKYEDNDKVYTSQFQLLRPSEASGKRDPDFETDLQEFIDNCSLNKQPDKPTIYMIETLDNGFSMEEHPVNDNFEIKDLDVNYGYGFEKFHAELMGRFNNGTQGLVLFHGLPGTGKTYYIRHLLRKMASANKVVIYMPPNMVDHLVEPTFMTFLSGEVKRWSDEGFFCVLFIDAEPLLAKRQEGVRIQGVTNLLNMSDGILNDMLNLQIICTFNVDLKKLDSALLRPGRLIARKEFKALSELDANLLGQRLGIKHHFKGPATLSEIYAKIKGKNTLIHDVEMDKDASTLIDDF